MMAMRMHTTPLRFVLTTAFKIGSVVLLTITGCSDDGMSVQQPDGGNEDGTHDADIGPGDRDGSMADARPDSGNPGDLDAAPVEADATTADARDPGNQGIQDCNTACETFLTTDCNQPSAMFCLNAAQNCQDRHAADADCKTEHAAMDACAAQQAAIDFVCPLGTQDDPIRPYNTSEDVCVSEAIALSACLNS